MARKRCWPSLMNGSSAGAPTDATCKRKDIYAVSMVGAPAEDVHPKDTAHYLRVYTRQVARAAVSCQSVFELVRLLFGLGHDPLQDFDWQVRVQRASPAAAACRAKRVTVPRRVSLLPERSSPQCAASCPRSPEPTQLSTLASSP